jgi:hypothetical protein
MIVVIIIMNTKSEATDELFKDAGHENREW